MLKIYEHGYPTNFTRIARASGWTILSQVRGSISGRGMYLNKKARAAGNAKKLLIIKGLAELYNLQSRLNFKATVILYGVTQYEKSKLKLNTANLSITGRKQVQKEKFPKVVKRLPVITFPAEIIDSPFRKRGRPTGSSSLNSDNQEKLIFLLSQFKTDKTLPKNEDEALDFIYRLRFNGKPFVCPYCGYCGRPSRINGLRRCIKTSCRKLVAPGAGTYLEKIQSKLTYLELLQILFVIATTHSPMNNAFSKQFSKKSFTVIYDRCRKALKAHYLAKGVKPSKKAYEKMNLHFGVKPHMLDEFAYLHLFIESQTHGSRLALENLIQIMLKKRK